MKFRNLISVLFTLVFVGSSAVTVAQAAGYRYSRSPSSSGGNASMPVSGSIAMPGTTTATFTNPAGLVNGDPLRLSLQVGSPKPMEDPNLRALVLVGNGVFGASGGVDYLKPDGTASDSGWAVYGLAVNIAALDFTLGLSGRTGIKTAQGSDFNAGILIKPTQFVTLGATARSLNNQPDSYGVGIGVEMVSGFDLVADAAFDNKFKNGEFKPGVKVSNSFAGLSLSYGTGATTQFNKDFSAAVFLKVGSNSELEFEYNHGGDLPKYYAGLTFGF